MLSALADRPPQEQIELLGKDPAAGRALVDIHARWDSTGSPNIFEWLELAAGLPEDSQMREAIANRIAEAAKNGGFDAPALPKGLEAPDGPTADQMQAAAGMAPAERDQMINGMIEKLAGEDDIPALAFPVQAHGNQDGCPEEAETAVRAGFEDIEKTIDLTEGGLVVTPDENNRRAEAFRKMLAQAPDTGKNNFLITHKPNIVDALGKDWFDVKEGEASIFKPEGGKYRRVARVQMEDWPKLAVTAN